MFERLTLKRIYAIYKFLFLSITFIVFVHEHPNLRYSVAFSVYLLDAVLVLVIDKRLFDLISLIIDVAFAYFLAKILSIEGMIAFSIVPLFLSCPLVDTPYSVVLLLISLAGVLLYSNINALFAGISYVASFTSSCLLVQSLKQAKLTRKRKEFEREFKEKLAIAKRLSLEFAHEIRNPLMSMYGAIEVIKRTQEKKTLQEMIEILQQEIERANNLVRDFLNLEKPYNLNKERFELCGFVEEFKALKENLIDIEIRCANVPIMIEADKTMITKMLENLLRNSIEAGATKVILTLEKKEDDVILLFEDNGSGIELDIEDRDKIFLPFFTTKNQGSGLGLSICKQVVEAHGGTIEIYSDHGFKITLKGVKDG